MVKTADVVAGADILTNWGNEIRDRTAQVFASAAERDNQWAAPPDGALAYTADLGTLWLRRAGAWVAATGTGQPPYTGSGVGVYTDPHGEVWVSKPGVFGGAWQKARDVVSAKGWRNGAFGAPNNTVITMDVAAYDPLNSFGDPAHAGIYTCPIAGAYMALSCISGLSTAAAQLFVSTVNRAGVQLLNGVLLNSAGAGNVLSSPCSGTFLCGAGDTISVTVGFNPANMGGYAGEVYTYLNVQWLHT